ncbi:MAG: ABC transporter permease [Chloroflexota bacterium]|nr:ABC transporter permease [Chloroflexota bacterium]
MLNLRALFARQEFIIFIVLVALCAIIAIINPTAFLNVPNAFRILRACIVIGIFALGALMVLISGGIDVSFPAIAICALYLSTLIIVDTGIDSVPLAFALGGLIGLALGLVNAVFIGIFKLPTLIVTLGTLNLFRGALLFFAGSVRIRLSEVTTNFADATRWNIITVPAARGEASLHFSILILLGLALLVWFILRYTMLGRAIYAIGGDREAAERAGFNIVRTQFFIYGFVGFLAGIGGIVFGILAREADPFAIVGTELDVIAAVVLGGASILGGRGTVIGTLLGVLLITLISSNLVLLGIPTEWQRFVIGALIIIGVGIPALQSLRRKVRHTQLSGAV